MLLSLSTPPKTHFHKSLLKAVKQLALAYELTETKSFHVKTKSPSVTARSRALLVPTCIAI